MEKLLNAIYDRYNRREYVHPDPLEFLYDYPDVREREVAGLVASSLAYGRVSQILASVSAVLGAMVPAPVPFLEASSRSSLERTFRSFKHRFTIGRELAGMLYGVKKVLERYGSLNACFLAGLDGADETYVPALTSFVGELRRAGGFGRCGLLPSPADGSACKRLWLYLRWMVRRDAVDPGGWVGVHPSKLVVPLDTHMYRIARSFGFTERRSDDGKTAAEVTAAFRRFAPEDPVRYDFALTRLGIRRGRNKDGLVERTPGNRWANRVI